MHVDFQMFSLGPPLNNNKHLSRGQSWGALKKNVPATYLQRFTSTTAVLRLHLTIHFMFGSFELQMRQI